MSEFEKCLEGRPPRTDYTREEIIERYQRCEENLGCCDGCPGEMENCSGLDKALWEMFLADGVIIANQQREIDALRQANEGLRYNLEKARAYG